MDQVYLIVTEKQTFSTLEAATTAAEAANTPYTIISRTGTAITNVSATIAAVPAPIVVTVLTDSEKALIHAVLHSNWYEVKALLDAGGNPNLKSVEGNSLLHAASEKGCTMTVGVLLKAGADVNGRDVNGNTPLHAALPAIPNPTVIMALLAAGANVNVRDNLGYTPLMYAVMDVEADIYLIVEALEILLKAGADINVVNKNGCTALYYAVDCGPLVCRYLLEAGADPRAKGDDDHHSPYDQAIASGDKDVIAVFNTHMMKTKIVPDIQSLLKTKIAAIAPDIQSKLDNFPLHKPNPGWYITTIVIEFENDNGNAVHKTPKQKTPNFSAALEEVMQPRADMYATIGVRIRFVDIKVPCQSIEGTYTYRIDLTGNSKFY